MKSLVVLVALICALPSVFAQKIVVVNVGEIKPLSYLENGKPAGISVEILEAVARDGQYKFDYKFMPWARAQIETKEAKTIGIIPLTLTEDRKPDYVWAAELFQQNLVFVTAHGNPAPKTMAEALKLKIGLLRGNQAENLLPAAAQIELVATGAQNAQKLQAKRIDTWLVSEFGAVPLWKDAGGNAKELNFGLAFGEPARVFLGGGLDFSKKDAAAIDATVKKLHKDGTIAKILAKYRLNSGVDVPKN